MAIRAAAQQSNIERWRPAIDRRGTKFDHYQVSDKGRVLSRHREPHIMKPAWSGGDKLPDGSRLAYLAVRLSQAGRSTAQYLHQLVARSFISLPPAGHTVNHVSGDRADNAVQNLEWATPSRQQEHSYRSLGRKSYHADTTRDKLTPWRICVIRGLHAEGCGAQFLADFYRCARQTIRDIVTRRTWRKIPPA